jgi:hypothetical protein
MIASLRVKGGPVKPKSIDLGLDRIAITSLFALKVVGQLFSHDFLTQVETRNVMGRVVDSGNCARKEKSAVEVAICIWKVQLCLLCVGGFVFGHFNHHSDGGQQYEHLASISNVLELFTSGVAQRSSRGRKTKNDPPKP